MKSLMYILVDKHPVTTTDALVWAMFMEHEDRVVASTIINGIHVSTVFLGLDHNFGGGEPILYETMIFGGSHDQHHRRYHTWQEAEQGHQNVLELVRAMIEVDELIKLTLNKNEDKDAGIID